LNDVQASVAKRGVINDWLNDRFGSTADNQIFQCSGLFVEQTSHISLNGVRPLMPFSRPTEIYRNKQKAGMIRTNLTVSLGGQFHSNV